MAPNEADVPTLIYSEANVYRYDWYNELLKYYMGGVYHQFILHFNVNDYYLVDDTTFERSLDRYLYRVLRELFKDNMAYFVFYPSLGFELWKDDNNIQNVERIVNAAGLSMDVILSQDSREGLLGRLRQIERMMLARMEENSIYRVFVIKYLEKLAPPDSGSSPVVEFFQRWALNESILYNQNLIILITDTLEFSSDHLFGQGRRCRDIRIPLPSLEQRMRFFQLIKEKEELSEVQLKDGDDLQALANLTRGFTLYDCHALNCITHIKRQPINEGEIEDLKKDIILSQSRNLLAEVQLGEQDCFEAVGGLDYIKNYLERLSQRLLAGTEEEKLTVPKGILLAGPPGTGKTILARALAHESRIPMVRMGNIRDKWVGESERNLDRVLNLIEDLAPVLVFVDEIDQAIGGRVTASADSGVGQRMFGRLLEFMGREELRGQVLWVAASNRPDMLDEAMIRRFDKIIPLLLPGESERAEIFRALPHSIKGLAYAEGMDFIPIAKQTEGLTGSDINVIVRTAMETGEQSGGKVLVNTAGLNAAIAKFKSNHNTLMYDLQTLYSLRYCNFLDMIPAPEDFPVSLRQVMQETMERKNNLPIDLKIQELTSKMAAGMR